MAKLYVLKSFLVLSVALNMLRAKELAQPRDLWTEAEDLLDELDKMVAAAIATSQREIGTLHNDILAMANSISLDARIKMQNSIDDLLDQLDNLQAIADSIGGEYCMEDRQQELLVIYRDLVQDVRECIDHISQEALNTISNITIQSTLAEMKIRALRQSLEECNQDHEDLMCIITVKRQISDAIQLLPTTILDDTIRVLTMTKDWEVAFHLCADHRSSLLWIEGNKLVLQVEYCFADLTKDETAGKHEP